ncbi:DUF3169 family protein [Dorea longicatena]|uniref:DUF3169 family protein n=1 Tax=Dorea longicatena TaxID=88431 RepID=A0A6N9JTS4_9FIRM|nr:DUF3169 family protein [Dorea longicatena]
MHHNFILWIFFEVYRIRKIQIFFIRLHYIYTVLFYDIYLSVRYVKAIQAAHPEKKGDPTSSKFTEQWVESCDEAEKEIIYKSAYKTYIVLNKVIPILLLLTLIANMFLNTGILAVLVVAVIYLVTGMTYIRSCMVSKAKRIG